MVTGFLAPRSKSLAGIDLNLLGLWYPKLPLCRTATRNFDHCPFDISLFPSPTALDIKASYSPKGS